ncbi:hypothetical protein [Hymenobacter frigidus]|nr:hypothetical protein [Hymenobacter frigidus]
MNAFAAEEDSIASDRRARLLLAALLGISVLMAFITRGTYDSGDSIKHYLFARYAFEHPLNLLESWAKPLFTLLAAGPAQAGFMGMKLFQCAVVATSAWCAYVVARSLRLPAPELTILFAYAMPDYFLIQFSGLTEPLFGLVLVGAVALGEPGWVFARNPYATVSVYGHGNWNHFLISLPGMLGWVLTLLAALGGGRMLRDCLRPARRQEPLFSAELLLVYGSITVFVLAHTIFWARGLFNSFGLTRVLDVTAPLFAVVAVNGLAWLMELGRSTEARRRISIGATVAVVAFLFTGARNAFRWQRDFVRPPDQVVADTAAAWMRQH